MTTWRITLDQGTDAWITCADEQHIVGLRNGLELVHGDLRVAHVALEQEGLAADHAVHQEVVLHEVQHLVRHVQRGRDVLLPGSVGDALQKQTHGN